MPGEDPINVAEIARAVDDAHADWTAAETALTTLPADERRVRLGAVPPPGQPSLAERERAATSRSDASEALADLPAAVDLRNWNGGNYVTPIKDQKRCGSCVAFGSLAAIESTVRVVNRQPDRAIDLSEAHLFYCHAAAEGRRCNTGWWVDPSLTACRDKGVVDETAFPYVDGDQACRIDANSTAARFKILSYKTLAAPGEMKAWLATKGALVACFTVYEDFYSYRSGVYRHVTGAREGGHCVCIIGYDDAQRCWIAKNSWGDDWGEDGYFKILAGDCGIDYEMWGVEISSGPDTGTWLKKRKVTGLWVDADEGATAAFIAGVGWRHVSKGPSAADMLLLLSIARSSGAPVDLLIVDNTIRELYVL